MKKTFQLKAEGKDPARLLETIKKEIRKYIKRENRKKLPEDKDYWRFYCAFGKNSDSAKEIQFPDIMKNIDTAAKEEWDTFYLELTTSAVKRNAHKDEA